MPEECVIPDEGVESSDLCTPDEAAVILGLTGEVVEERLVRGLMLGVFTEDGWRTSRRYVLDLAAAAGATGPV
jgi:hypothetical protein